MSGQNQSSLDTLFYTGFLKKNISWSTYQCLQFAIPHIYYIGTVAVYRLSADTVLMHALTGTAASSRCAESAHL